MKIFFRVFLFTSMFMFVGIDLILAKKDSLESKESIEFIFDSVLNDTFQLERKFYKGEYIYFVKFKRGLNILETNYISKNDYNSFKKRSLKLVKSEDSFFKSCDNPLVVKFKNKQKWRICLYKHKNYFKWKYLLNEIGQIIYKKDVI